MKTILDYAKEKKIVNENNAIIEKSVKTEIKEDRVVKIITKEVTDFFARLFTETNNYK